MADSYISRRPLLQGGERLRQEEGRPRTGGGDKYEPFTTEEVASRLLPAARSLRAAAAQIPTSLRGERLVVEAVLTGNHLANSYFPESLLEWLDAESVGTRYSQAPQRTRKDPDGLTLAPTKSLFLSVADRSLASFERLLAQPASPKVPSKVKTDLLTLEQLRLPTAADRLRPPIQSPQSLERGSDKSGGVMPPLLEAVLHPEASNKGPIPAGALTLARWFELVDKLGGEVESDWVRVAGDLTFVPVRLDHPTHLEAAAQFNALRSLHAMPLLRDPGDVRRSTPLTYSAPEQAGDDEAEEPLRVAVFDGGCDDSSPFYAGRVREIVLGGALENPRARAHGALVTSALLYGQNPTSPLIPANTEIDHYRVLPVPGRTELEMYWLLDTIKDTLSTREYDVVNLSIGPQRAFVEDEVDRWTSELDALSNEKDILFVVAAGNDGASPSAELRRVQIPGDMVNGLTVGACDDSAPAKRAPYSSHGPGRAGGRVQPSGVAFGGTAKSPFRGTDADGVQLSDTGTSFSAPLVVHGLCDLVARVGRQAVSGPTLRAFALHFATPCHKSESPQFVGHGQIPTSYEEALDCSPNEVHVLYRGTIGRDEYLPLALPLPDSIDARIGLKWTLVTLVDTDPGDAVEYAKAGLDIVFRPHANKRSFTKSGERTQVVDVVADASTARDLLLAGYSPSQAPASEGAPLQSKGESVLREEGKWETVRQARLKRFQRGRLYRPRLDISHISREAGRLAKGTRDLDYALLVSLSAPAGTEMYDAVLAQYPVLVPITSDVTVSATSGS